MRFSDHVVVITGAGRGIGAATAEAFVAEGARVALLARTEKELRATADRLGAEQSLALRCDVADEGDVVAAFKAVRRHWGNPRHLVNNAGTVGAGRIVETSAATWDRVQAVNLRGAFLCAREF